ncbi:MAG TPA: hypothetical protein PKD53_26820 [Chloroflexaceae bacterium]|nr:hypothetical protein [Chloroflexaceae bacterium]
MTDPRGQRGRRGETERLPEWEHGAGADGRRTTERLSPDGDEWSQAEPVNPGWRSERAGSRRSPRRGALPSSPQEFQLWLQAGGWRYVAGIAVLLVVLLIAMLAFARNDQREAGLGFDQPAPTTASEPVLGGGGDTGAGADALPTVTPPPPSPAAPQRFVVTGTGGQGLFLRPAPSTDGAPLTTLPDGTVIEQIGEDVAGGDPPWGQGPAPPRPEGYRAAAFPPPAPRLANAPPPPRNRLLSPTFTYIRRHRPASPAVAPASPSPYGVGFRRQT